MNRILPRCTARVPTRRKGIAGMPRNVGRSVSQALKQPWRTSQRRAQQTGQGRPKRKNRQEGQR
eukprot:5422627-Alexandrium_andersonii.AAC.1